MLQAEAAGETAAIICMLNVKRCNRHITSTPSSVHHHGSLNMAHDSPLLLHGQQHIPTRPTSDPSACSRTCAW